MRITWKFLVHTGDFAGHLAVDTDGLPHGLFRAEQDLRQRFGQHGGIHFRQRCLRIAGQQRIGKHVEEIGTGKEHFFRLSLAFLPFHHRRSVAGQFYVRLHFRKTGLHGVAGGKSACSPFGSQGSFFKTILLHPVNAPGVAVKPVVTPFICHVLQDQ